MALHNLRRYLRQNIKRLATIFVAIFVLFSIPVIGMRLTAPAPGIVEEIPQQFIIHPEFLHPGNDVLLYDFNYLMTVLEENWPFFNLSYNAGVDVHKLADNVRATLSDTTTADKSVHEFMDYLRVHFFYEIWPIGRMQLFYSSSIYQNRILSIASSMTYSGGALFNAPMFTEILTRPEAMMFYHTLDEAGESQLPNPEREWLRQVQQERSDIGLPAYTTTILQEGYLALLTVNQIMAVGNDNIRTEQGMRWYESLLHNFYVSIAGFEHLIIDMREPMIFPAHCHFDTFVAGPLLREEIRLPAYVFYKPGIHSDLVRNTHDLRMWTGAVYDDFRLCPVSFDLPPPYLDMDIHLPHVFYSQYTIQPTGQEVLFDGTIWMLVGDYTRLTAEAAVAIFKLNDLATVVGEPTRGTLWTIYDASRMLMSFPNTGMILEFETAYITDFYGRPLLGYGIQPHYTNRPGMDALETVLAMINE